MELYKKKLRMQFLGKRKQLTPYKRKVKNRQICSALLGNFKLPNNYIIAGYWPLKSEVDISLALEAYLELGNKVCLPKIIEPNAPLEFREYKKGLTLVQNETSGFSLLEPKNTESLVPDMVIVPLVAFDTACNRLGMGGGFYDRTLEQISAHKDIISVGVGYSCQQHNYLETSKYDFSLDAIVTEEKVFFKDSSFKLN